MMNEPAHHLQFQRLREPNPEIAAALDRWANDPELVPFMRPSRSRQELEEPVKITPETLAARLQQHPIYLIYAEGNLVGEMNYQIDPDHLYRKIPGTAWVGITIGDRSAWGRGIGTRAMRFLEERIREAGCLRIELGVFEFNTRAQHLYRKLGYREIGRIDQFTFWKGKMWQDIRMEKLISRI